MDQPENDFSQSLRTIFENSEIYVTVNLESDVDRITGMGGQTFMTYRGPSRCTLNLKVKQRHCDFQSGKKNWDEAVFMELMTGTGVFVSRNQAFNIGNADIISDYTFHIHDMSGFTKSVNKYAEELYNKQFTQALETKLSED